MSTHWFYAKNGKKEGPLTAEEMRNRCESHEVKGSDLIWTHGMEKWMHLSCCGEALHKSGIAVAIEPCCEGPCTGKPDKVQLQSHGGSTTLEQERDIHELGATGPQRRPWVRLAARYADWSLVGILFGFLVAPSIDYDWLRPPYSIVLGAMLMYLGFFIEAALLNHWASPRENGCSASGSRIRTGET